MDNIQFCKQWQIVDFLNSQKFQPLLSSGPAHLPFSSLTFHRRTTPNLALPPSCAILWTSYEGAFPLNLHNGLPDCHFLRPRRHLALLVTPSFTYASSVQDDPQDPPPMQCSVRACRRIRFSYRSHDARFRHCWLPNFVVRVDG